ncbi:GMC family oxidoreductase [Kordiimonas aquimaris]|uniref:GMC family oxidoreductase n=1 Tax=Kordiimonas aquimaris TaxID=707591 RepID=UPI0021D3140A|nr:GMC family oxidoreductase N-terminal domain-containing protein [Kordiimonas aquimaris]
MPMKRYDYIIVGAGSAGCVLANRLTASGRYSVLLLEAGAGDSNPMLRIPLLGSLLTVGSPKYDWCYRTAADPTRGGRQERWPRGKVLGGSSALNAMIYVRGAAADYDHWAQLGNSGWSYDDVVPFFNKIEGTISPMSADHTGGMVRMANADGAHPLSYKFIDALTAQGTPYFKVGNNGSKSGVSLLRMTSSGRVRQSSAYAYLKPAKSRPNLHVMTHSHAARVIFEGRKAVGIEYHRRGKTYEVFAGKEVILSGGSINSPQLLMLSGVGPAEDLSAIGIKPIMDLAGVGKNLHDHPAVFMQAYTNVPSYNTETMPPRVFKHVADWALRGQGMLSTVMFQALAFVKTNAVHDYPDIQLHFAPCGYVNTETSVEPIKQNSFTIQANVNRPQSRGFLKLADKSPASYPIIQPNMFDDTYDLNTLISGVKYMKSLIEGAVFNDVIDRISVPALKPITDSDWELFVRENAQTAYHPVGTCKMGTDDMSVVTQELRVVGTHGLRVVDGSVMPQIISGNTQAAIMMIAEKAADMILA